MTPRTSTAPEPDVFLPHSPRWWATLCSGVGLWLAGCATTPPPLPVDAVALPLAVSAGLDQLVAQVQSGPVWLARLQTRTLIMEPVLDQPSGQQTRATPDVEGQVIRHLAAERPRIKVTPVGEAAGVKADWLLTGTLLWSRAGEQPRRPTLQLDLSDAATGQRLARAVIRVRGDSVDSTPTAFFQDSPVLVSAPVASPGVPARVPLAEVGVDAPLQQGMATYNDGRSADALALFEAAEKAGGAEDMRVQIGLYLAYRKLGRTEQANRAFARIAALGIKRRSLAVKFLFEPGKLDFWADPQVSGQYGMWVEQIATQAASTRVCVNVVGHGSRTGTAEFNDQLSLQRAQRIAAMLTRAAPALGTRLQETGKGFRENLVGTGTDDAHDALDRRVEFRFEGC